MSNVTSINSAGQGQGGVSNQLRKTALPGRTYNKANYYPTTSGEANGHRKQKRINFARNVDDAVKIVVSIDENYRHEHDFHRDAAIHHLMRRADEAQLNGFIEASEEVRELVDLQIQIDRQKQIREIREMQREHLRDIQDNVAIAVETVDHDLMDELITIVEDKVNDDTLPWGVRQDWEELHDHLTREYRAALQRVAQHESAKKTK